LHGIDSNIPVLGELEAEEYNNDRARQPSVESRGEYVIVLAPPGEMTSPNNVLEDESDKRPGYVVDRGRGRDGTGTREDDGEVDVLEDGIGVPPCDKVWNPRCDSSNKEEEGERVVELTLGELESWPNDAPDDRGGSEHLSGRADESVLLFRMAHSFDVGEHPSLNTELNGTSNDSRYDLTPEHGTRRNLHVVAKFEVTGESKRLSHGNVTPGLEHHHCDGMSGESITDDQFGDDVQADLLIGDGLDHANGDDVHEGDDEREDECPDWHLGFEDLDRDDTEDEHGHENSGIPPLGNLWVNRHETSVNVGLFAKRTPALDPDLLPEVKDSMHDGRSDGGERQAIGNSESRREEQRRVCVVSFEIDRRVSVKNLADIVRMTGIVERPTGRNG